MLLEFFGTDVGSGPQCERASQPGREETQQLASDCRRAPSVVDHTKRKTEADPTGVRCK